MRRQEPQRGQSVLYTILLMPMLLLVLSLVADVGSLQVERVRLAWAQDMALVDAVTQLDVSHYGATASLQLEASAADVFRGYLAANLEAMRSQLAAGATPESIAAGAEVHVVNAVPASDPFTGRRLTRPTISARTRAPFRSGLLALAGVGSVQTITVTGSAEMKGDQP